MHEVLWGSRFRVHHRVADVYRAGRVLLAGDAAHVHSPAGGQGMNAGILDAMRLADALVTALAGDDPAALDAYGAERRPVAQQVVALADRLTRLATVRPGLRGLRNLLPRRCRGCRGSGGSWRGGCRGWSIGETLHPVCELRDGVGWGGAKRNPNTPRTRAGGSKEFQRWMTFSAPSGVLCVK